MAELKYRPVPHEQEAFLKRAQERMGFQEAYEELRAVGCEVEIRLVPAPRPTTRSSRTTRKQVSRRT